MSKLIELYKKALSFCSMEADKEGAVSIGFVFDKKDKLDVKLDGKQLYLPTQENLKSFDPEKAVIFHPLMEYVNRGESDIVKLMRNQLNVRINYTTLTVCSHLLRLLTSPAEHKKLTPEQRELLLEVNTDDMQINERFMSFVANRFANATNRFFTNIYLKKAGTFQGQKHARVGVVQFPFYEAFEGTDKELKLKKGDKEVFQALFNFVFPGSLEKFNASAPSEEAEAYNNFSDNRDAPWLCCLFKTAGGLAERLNYLIDLYGDFIPNKNDYLFNMSWSDTTENFESFEHYRLDIKLIPAQRGNEGSSDDSKVEVAPQTIVALPEPTRQAPIQQPPQAQYYDPRLPQAQQQPVVRQEIRKNADGSVNFDEAMQRNPALMAGAFVNTPLTQWQQQQQMPMMHPGMMGQNPMGGWGQMPGQMMAYQDPRIAPMGRHQHYTGMAPQGQMGYANQMYPGRSGVINI